VPHHRPGGPRVWRNLIACALAAAALYLALPAQSAHAASIHSIITTYTLAAHFTDADVTAMKKIADYESHDHPKSHGRTGHGLFQLSAAMVKGHPWTDPVWNTKRALTYIKGRYGTPRKAWAHIHDHGWY
jgi:hypothetical protein